MRLTKLFEDRSAERLAYIMDYLKNNPEAAGKFEKRIREINRQDDPMDDLKARLDPRQTAPEKDHASTKIIDRFIKAMVDADGDQDDMTNFINNYGKVDYINTAALMKENEIVSMDSWIKAGDSVGVSREFVLSLFNLLFPKDNFGGPGETALALLSPNITRPEGNKGDLVINGVNVELKGQNSEGGGGRLANDKNSIGTPNVQPIYDKIYALPNWREGDVLPDFKRISCTTTGRVQKGNDKTPLRNVVQKIDEYDKKLADEFLKEMITGAFTKSAGSYSSVFNGWRNFDYTQMHAAASKMAFLNYKTELEAKTGGVKTILMVNRHKKLSVCWNTDNFDNIRQLFKLGPIDWGDQQNNAAVQLSL